MKVQNGVLRRFAILRSGPANAIFTETFFNKSRRFLHALYWALAVLGMFIIITLLADGIDGMQKFLQFLVGGIGLGFIYALIALGFVIIYKSTGIFNFAQGGFVLLGAYISYQFVGDWGFPFFLGVFCSILMMSAVGAGVERVIMRPMLGKPPQATVLVTLGLLILVDQTVRAVWTEPTYTLMAPWDGNNSTVGGVFIDHADLWNALIAVALLVAFWGLFQFTRIGLSMRATAISQETSASQGIRVGVSFSLSWIIAAALGAVSGTLLIFDSGGAVTPALSFVALRAFPAMILGGLDSTIGAVVAGVLLGVVEIMTQGYVDVDWLGSSFDKVVPYIVMVGALLWRPEGLFGTKTVERI